MQWFLKYVIVIVGGVIFLGLLAYFAGTYYENQHGELNKEKIIGTWYRSNCPLTFTKDGTVTITSEKGEEMHGTYTIDGHDLIMVVTDDDGGEKILFFVVKIVGKVLFLWPDGSDRAVVFERK